MNKYFLEYFVNIDKIYWKILFNTWDKIFGDVEEYFVTCSWMNDIYG
jgi:hypothetical protein